MFCYVLLIALYNNYIMLIKVLYNSYVILYYIIIIINIIIELYW